MFKTKKVFLLLTAVFISACNQDKPSIPEVKTKAKLGAKLFIDTSLSRDGNQSCASCHDSERAFIDSRINLTSPDANTAGAVSVGQDSISLGDINAPQVSYTAFVPNFHYDENEELFKGGLFFDGRAKDLTEQAKQPFLNPVEMQNTKENVVEAVINQYSSEMMSLYGNDIFTETEKAFSAIADAIAAFEKTEEVSPFNSKFDKYLRGEESLTAAELRGLILFQDENRANCAACHPVATMTSSKSERLWTDFSYDNLGVPKNTRVRENNGKGDDFIDNGLFGNPQVNDTELKGAFRVSSLRNIAVTAPYMHNGVFKDLSTVVHFYNSRDVQGAINPETGDLWEAAEVDETKNTEELGNLGLSDEEINDIVIFLQTLTDEKFVHLLD
jgi:cytochrome c peroxidase